MVPVPASLAEDYARAAGSARLAGVFAAFGATPRACPRFWPRRSTGRSSNASAASPPQKSGRAANGSRTTPSEDVWIRLEAENDAFRIVFTYRHGCIPDAA